MKKSDRNREALLRMTYGNLRKLNNSLYITNRDGTELQEIINVNTGEKIDLVHVIKQRMFNSKTGRFNNRYYDNINKSKYKLGFVFTHPQHKLHNDYFKIYNKNGELIHSLFVPESQGIWFDELRTVDNKVIISLIIHPRHKHYCVIYNLETDKVEDVFESTVEVDKETLIKEKQFIVTKLDSTKTRLVYNIL